jgi:hypothetical protein
VFYTIKTYHIADNRGGLWSIHSESISNAQIVDKVKFLGVFRIQEFYIEWIAIGY